MDNLKKLLASRKNAAVKVDEPVKSIYLENSQQIPTVDQDNSQPEVSPQKVCNFFYDTGKYGEVRYWCKDSKRPGLLSTKPGRMPIKDMQHIERNCRNCFEECPLFFMK